MLYMDFVGWEIGFTLLRLEDFIKMPGHGHVFLGLSLTDWYDRAYRDCKKEWVSGSDSFYAFVPLNSSRRSCYRRTGRRRNQLIFLVSGTNVSPDDPKEARSGSSQGSTMIILTSGPA